MLNLQIFCAVSVVVGIPHVKREINYLYTTLNSLFAALSDEEKLDSMFIVFIGEVPKLFHQAISWCKIASNYVVTSAIVCF